ncbi:pre-rRNA-processing protein TSR2 [Tanacetum coccineum]
MAASSSDSTKVTLKLLIDTKSKKVLFAEANKEFVDFLFHILSLPVGTVIKLLRKNSMVGALGNLYDSIENLSSTYMQSDQLKEAVLNPKVTKYDQVPLLLANDDGPVAGKFYRCPSNCYNYVTDDPTSKCPHCKSQMSTVSPYVAGGGGVKGAVEGGGFVKGVVTYMVMDDLVVKPMSTISSITMLNKFNVKEVGALEEKMVSLEMKEVCFLCCIRSDVAEGLFSVQECAYQCLPVLKVLSCLNKDHETFNGLFLIAFLTTQCVNNVFQVEYDASGLGIGGEEVMVVPAQLTAEAVNQLREGIDLILGRWSALQMAIHNEWGGRDTSQKAQQLATDIYRWLIRPAEALYVDELENLLDDFMLSLNTEIDDGSIEEIADNLMIMHEECLEGNFASIERLRQSIPIPPLPVHVMGCEDDSDTTSSSGDESMEMGDDFDPASNMSEMAISEPPRAPAPAPAPTVDADGWTTVTSRRNRGGRH